MKKTKQNTSFVFHPVNFSGKMSNKMLGNGKPAAFKVISAKKKGEEEEESNARRSFSSLQNKQLGP